MDPRSKLIDSVNDPPDNRPAVRTITHDVRPLCDHQFCKDIPADGLLRRELVLIHAVN